jgi:cyclopropane-fatty-acyl-phospholipid synthase
MWEKLLIRFLASHIRFGDLTVAMPGGEALRFGNHNAPHVSVALKGPGVVRRLALNPELAVGEAYMDQDLTIDGDDLDGFLRLAMMNRGALNRQGAWFSRTQSRLGRAIGWVRQLNRDVVAQRNVAHHYDLSGELFDLFLDEDRQYSCAFFADPRMSLDEAQRAKKDRIAAKLRLEPGQRVLDIGCGWGGLALTLARDHGVRVTGITLSKEQHAHARGRVEVAGLTDRIDIRLEDYRNTEGPFDRIVSVGMFEHVGVPNYRTFFGKVRDLLTDDGIALIHTIGRTDPPSHTNPFIAKYIFPGGYIPAVSEVAAAIEREALFITDLEVWRLHYAETLRHWYERFVAREDEARALFDERFCRMWRFYLLAAEQGFRTGQQAVFQYQLTRGFDVLPPTRDYMAPKRKKEQLPVMS